jgi:hypothetical protein
LKSTTGGVEILTNKKWGEDGTLIFEFGKDSQMNTGIAISFKVKKISIKPCISNWKDIPGISAVPENKKYLVWRFDITPGTTDSEPILLKFWVNDVEITTINPQSFCTGTAWRNSLTTGWVVNFVQFRISSTDDATIGYRTYNTGD